jgi:predicted amidophosphoribosyltransferase
MLVIDRTVIQLICKMCKGEFRAPAFCNDCMASSGTWWEEHFCCFKCYDECPELRQLCTTVGKLVKQNLPLFDKVYAFVGYDGVANILREAYLLAGDQ